MNMHTAAGPRITEKAGMLRLARPGALSQGFTLVELVITMTVALVIATAFYTFFKTDLISYLDLQADASNFTTLAAQSQRIASVVRGLSDIISADANDLQIYAYFSPTDTYASQVHYYLNADKTELLADITQMTANPPVGSPIPSTLKTYTIIPNFRQSPGVDLFGYLDSANNTIATPVADLSTVKAIQINLGVDATGRSNQAMTLQVSLRNRKTNL